MTAFALHEQLANDCFLAGDLPLCRVLLMNDCRFAWAILVPRRAGLVEIMDLASADRARLVEEIAQVAAALKKLSGAGKMNVGALGNIVRQLHVHIVGRSEGDDAWPGPVWGAGARVPYTDGAGEACARELRKTLGI
ncbi:MAG: HIT family protein [Parvularculaceae bacterium]|nr:HIT family protein [Parvularculaceae bacterium]